MSDVVLRVPPDVLRQAANGINGIIDGLAGDGYAASYSGQLGRGFDGLSLTGEQMSTADAKAGMDNFVQRWEWGTRALVTVANDIGHTLHMGAGMYERQASYFNNAAKDMVNDLAGDPSLQKESTYDANGNLISRGTDDMGWGEMASYNANQLTHPDWSAQSFANTLPQLQQSWDVIKENAAQAGMNLVLPPVMPGGAVQSTVDGFMQPDQSPTA